MLGINGLLIMNRVKNVGQVCSPHHVLAVIYWFELTW